MKFIHTADWQLGMKAAHVGEAATRVREVRLAASRRVVGLAQERSVEFVLVAGDTFEDNGVERSLIQTAADILGSCPVPVYVIPGNHDPITPGSVWEHPAWRSMGHVRVLRDENPVEVPGGILYPCPYSGTLETTSFGERDSGNVLVVEIAGPGAPPLVIPVRTGGLRWMKSGEADEIVRAMISKNAPGGGLSRPEKWGLAQVLWTTQGELALEGLSGG